MCNTMLLSITLCSLFLLASSSTLILRTRDDVHAFVGAHDSNLCFRAHPDGLENLEGASLCEATILGGYFSFASVAQIDAYLCITSSYQTGASAQKGREAEGKVEGRGWLKG